MGSIHPRDLDLREAAALLQLPEAAVQALAGAGYVRAEAADDGPRFAIGELKGFLARVADDGEATIDLTAPAAGDVELDATEPQRMLEELGARCDDMAARALERLDAVIPEAATWTPRQRARFVADTRGRLEAIVAVACYGGVLDDEMLEEIIAVGASAAGEGTALPQLLVVMRIARDQLVHGAVALCDHGGEQWGLVLSVVLSRLFAAIDQLMDAIARGYWLALIAGRSSSDS